LPVVILILLIVSSGQLQECDKNSIRNTDYSNLTLKEVSGFEVSASISSSDLDIADCELWPVAGAMTTVVVEPTCISAPV